MPETTHLSLIANPTTRPPAHGFESPPRHSDKTTRLQKINPAKWPAPCGYPHPVAGTGTFVFISGQIATDNAGRVTTVGLVPQARQALRNVRTVLAEAGGVPGHIAQMTWYVLDVDLYRAQRRELGLLYRKIMGSHDPAMALVEVSGLVDPAAVVEIAATAMLPVAGRSSSVGSPPVPWGGVYPASTETSRLRRSTMTTHLPPITVTRRDHRRLMHTAEYLAGQAHPLAEPLLRELRRATLCAPDELPEDVVTLDTFVAYRLASEGKSEKRMLIHPDDRMWPPAELSVLTPLGLSLIGLRVGDRMPLIGLDGTADGCVEVEAVGPRVTGSFVPLGAAVPDGRGRGRFCSRVRRRNRRNLGPFSGPVASSGLASRC